MPLRLERQKEKAPRTRTFPKARPKGFRALLEPLERLHGRIAARDDPQLAELQAAA
jgi:hypothetical protein